MRHGTEVNIQQRINRDCQRDIANELHLFMLGRGYRLHGMAATSRMAAVEEGHSEPRITGHEQYYSVHNSAHMGLHHASTTRTSIVPLRRLRDRQVALDLEAKLHTAHVAEHGDVHPVSLRQTMPGDRLHTRGPG